MDATTKELPVLLLAQLQRDHERTQAQARRLARQQREIDSLVRHVRRHR